MGTKRRNQNKMEKMRHKKWKLKKWIKNETKNKN